ncbi:hypothetical protein EZ456_11605 [Pedobacter psychrodurus]|uniref:Uncharacterized protein n=1 Tax=Pedobacter psychrodurus TaxID=2530456 RepID=A0A4R0Q6V4_9SPHI|nr:hypothetical protein [Pedobacter psychrodurus]TCD27156.1 hypothetical protein EZ456_11605 [Pedobacter psychrodurus]
MIALPSFYILTSNGESILPDTIQRQRAADQNRAILFYLDANLCLDIVNYFENKQAHPQSKTNVEILILFCQQYNIEVIPKFGSMELCKETFNKLNIPKYQDFVNKITYAFDTPFSETVKLNDRIFNYYVEVNDTDSMGFEGLFPLLLMSYVSLLKIYFLCKKNNPNRGSVLKNLKLFLHWCNKHLNTSMASEIQLAIRIFGGDSRFRKMIALDKKGDQLDVIFRTLWGSAWDLLHMRMVHFKAINTGIDQVVYFITQDANLYELFKTCQLQCALSISGQPITSFVSYDIEIQYKDVNMVKDMNDILATFTLERSHRNSIEPLDIKLLENLRTKLEYDIHMMF